MAFFRKKIELNDIYVGIIGDMIQPETESWAIETLFPDFKYSSMKNQPKEALKEKEFSEEDFVTFLRAMVVSAVGGMASWVYPSQFVFFEQVIENEDLTENFSNFFDLKDFGLALANALNTADTTNIEENIIHGSAIYGRQSTMAGDQAHMFETATIALSFMIGYFSKHSPKIAIALQSDPSSSRDSLVDFFAHVVRYWNNVLKNYKPVF